MIEKNPLKHFSGIVPLFPLPNVVLFPKTMIPLHIFEKRYRIMLKEAMQGEKLIAMCTLKPGWETQYAGNPEVHSVACIGQIIQHEPLTDGKSNIVLLGLKRIRIKEIIHPKPYRKAHVEIIKDTSKGFSPDDILLLRERLLELYGEMTILMAGQKKHMPTLSHMEMSLGRLADSVAAGVGLPVSDMVHLLHEYHTVKRAQMVIEKLEELLDKPTNYQYGKIITQVKNITFPRFHLN